MNAQPSRLVDVKDENARLRIASRVGQLLLIDDLPDAECRAVAALSRELVEDAIESVRISFSTAAGRAKSLPQEVALKIAHDVDRVACPFLEVTEVFSDNEWRRLVMTISRGARTSVAQRSSMTEGLALALVGLGDSELAENLIENRATPMTEGVCERLITRFEATPAVLDKLSERDDLLAEIAATLITKVSAAAREKLSKASPRAKQGKSVGTDAAFAALFQRIRKTPESHLPALVQALIQEDRLSDSLLLAALRQKLRVFSEIALTCLSRVGLTQVQSIVRGGGPVAVNQLLRQAGISPAKSGEFLQAIEDVRRNRPTAEAKISA